MGNIESSNGANPNNNPFLSGNQGVDLLNNDEFRKQMAEMFKVMIPLPDFSKQPDNLGKTGLSENNINLDANKQSDETSTDESGTDETNSNETNSDENSTDKPNNDESNNKENSTNPAEPNIGDILNAATGLADAFKSSLGSMNTKFEEEPQSTIRDVNSQIDSSIEALNNSQNPNINDGLRKMMSMLMTKLKEGMTKPENQGDNFIQTSLISAMSAVQEVKAEGGLNLNDFLKKPETLQPQKDVVKTESTESSELKNEESNDENDKSLKVQI